MIILGIDPGPTTCGVVVYDTVARRVLAAASTLDVRTALEWAADRTPYDHTHDVVCIEQVMSTGQAGNDLLRTAEVCGRLYQRATDDSTASVVLIPRRAVCSMLGITGKGKDAQVRDVLIEMHGGSKRAAVGTKLAPGPLYGVSGHAWQALGVVKAWTIAQALDAARSNWGAA